MFKFFIKRRKKGQSTLEYAILIIIVLAALLSIQIYVKRGLQGRFKSAADDIGAQFSPGNTNVVMITRTKGQSRDTFKSGVTRSQLTKDEITEELMNAEVMVQNFEFWGK